MIEPKTKENAMTDREILLAEIEAEINKFTEPKTEPVEEALMKEVDIDLSIRESAAGTIYATTEIAELVEALPVVAAEEAPEEPKEPEVKPEPEAPKEVSANAIMEKITSSGVFKGYKGDRKETVMAVALFASSLKPDNYKGVREIVEKVMKERGEEVSYFKLQNFTDGFLKKLSAAAIISWKGKAKNPISWNE